MVPNYRGESTPAANVVGSSSSLSEHGLEGHGVVLLTDADGVIRHASQSGAGDLIGKPISALLSATDRGAIEAALAGDVAEFGWRLVALADGDRMKLHAFDPGEGLVGFDLLPDLPAPVTDAALPVERVAAWNEQFLACQTAAELLDQAAAITAQRTALDGVWVTQLLANGDGMIVAAQSSEELPARVGQRVPAADLLPGQPQIAGRMVPLFIADAAAAATALTPPRWTVDLQASALHRPFPSYLHGLERAGIRAVAAVPLVLDGRLWGRISAASPHPKRIPVAVQAELRLLAAAVAGRLAEILSAETAREHDELARAAIRVIRAASAADDLIDGLLADHAALCSVCDADSTIVATAGRIEIAGKPLQPAACAQIIASATRALSGPRKPVVATATQVPQHLDLDPADAAGYLAVRITAGRDDLIIWTRREYRQPVRWLQRSSGDTSPPLSERLEEQSGHCRLWTRAQQRQASDLRDALGELLASRYSAVAELNEELTRSNLEYDAFAHAAAHDLRAPIRGIQMTTEFLLEDLEAVLEPEQRDQIDSILRMASNMRELLDDLMAYAQVGKADWNPQPLGLEEAVAQAVELLGPRANDLKVTVEPATFDTDPTALRQLLMNLIGNSSKYRSTARSAVVEVRLMALRDVARQAPIPAPALRLDGDLPVLVVSDNGIGIDPAYHEQIFGLFRQLDTKAPGSGAGLALCRLIARRHGGEIWLQSTPGTGTTIYVATG